MTSHDGPVAQAQPQAQTQPQPPPQAFPAAADLDSWLAAHPAPHPGLWGKVAKRASGIVSVRWDEVNDIALCHGWITGQRKAPSPVGAVGVRIVLRS